ncbi:hypothetical protein BD413DRAFT_613595 [Trametes elegans]|nr:hypothetical protein BD413DRAFT_613595 [Trametes elegans]
MLARVLCVALCVVAACFACATATVVNDRAERRDIGSSIDSITSAIDSGYNNATSQVGSFVCAITEVDRGVGTVLTLVGSQVATVLTSNCASITLAPTGFGVATSFAGSTYTEATGNVTSVFAAAAR